MAVLLNAVSEMNDLAGPALALIVLAWGAFEVAMMVRRWKARRPTPKATDARRGTRPSPVHTPERPPIAVRLVK